MADEGQDHKADKTTEKPGTRDSYQDLFQDAIERVARLDSNAQFLSVNKQFAELFGYQAAEMIGMSLSELCVADDCEKSIDQFVEMKAKGRSEGIVKANTRAGDDFHLKLLLIKGIQKSDSSYFCYCIVDLVNPIELTDVIASNQIAITDSQQAVSQQQSGIHYRNLIEGLNAIFWECSYPDFKFTFISQSLKQILGFSPEEWQGTIKFNPDQIHPEDMEQVLETCLSSIKQGKDFELCYRVKNIHNKYVWLQDIISIVYDDNQNVFQLRGVTVDVSTNKVAEQIASNSRKRLFEVFDSIPDVIFETRLNDGIITRVNTSFTELTGFPKDEIIGRNCVDIKLFTDKTNQSLNEKLKSDGRIKDHSIEFRNNQGKKTLMSLSSVLVVDEKIPYVFSIASFSGNNNSIQGVLSKDEEDIQLLSSTLPISISYLDSDLTIGFVNKRFIEIFNPSKKELIGKKLNEVIGEEEFEKISQFLTIALNGKQVDFEYHGIKDFPGRYFEVSCIPKMSENGSVSGVYILSDDITEKRNSKTNELRLGEILEQSLSEVFIFDIQNRHFNYGNRGARDNIGYSLGELKHHHYLNITPELSDEKLNNIIYVLTNGSTDVVNINSHIKRKDGTIYFAEINVQFSEINGIKELVFLVNDITKREETEEKLKRAEKILSSIKDPILFLDTKFNVLFANETYLNTYRCTNSYVKNKNLKDLWDEQLFNERIKPKLEKALDGESKQEQLWMTLPAGKRNLSIQYSPYYSKQNTITGIVISIRDITELESTKHALSENEERFRLITMATNDALYDWDLQNKSVWRNEKDFTHLYSSTELEDWVDIIHPKDRDISFQTFKEAVKNKENYWSSEYRLKQIDGSYVTVYDRAYILYDDDKKPLRVMGAITDITDRKKVEQALVHSEERFRALYEDNPLMLFSLDLSGVILSLNKHVTNQLGYKGIDILGETIYSIIENDFIDNVNEAIKKSLLNLETIQRVELKKKLKSGGNIWVRYTIRSIDDRIDNARRILVVCEDISENKRLSEQLSYQASHDSLTGLVNRAEFERRLERILISMDQDSAHHALCYLDLDQFKIVNDTCGHLAGDELLRQISGILSNAVRKRDTLARLGGDEFGILMEHCTLEQAQRVANEMRKYIEDFRYIWEGKRFILGVSIGLVPIQPGSNQNLHSIMREADIACYAAKDAGRNRVHIYTPDDPDISGNHGQVQWAAIINQALDEERFSLFHQPIENISPFNSEPIGERFEVLLRMLDENNNLILPTAFMPAAERYNLAVKIDTWVFNNVLEWMTANTGRVENIKMCSINISGHSMNNIQYLDFVLQKLYETNIPPDKICFEITETAAISNISTALTLMQTIKSVGCMFALDDFGSGVSSFAYLKQLPVDYLKIDGSFVRDIVDDQVDYEMVRSIKDVAGVMGMKTIAEFVENESIKQKLLEIGIDYGQGFCISEPKILK